MSNNSSSNILSEKVARALQVRTDSTAMRASLQALSSSLENSSSSTIIDARSVRTAMEQDALQQAKLLQTALGDILETIQQLQQGCAQVAHTAANLRSAASQAVVTTAMTSSTFKNTVVETPDNNNKTNTNTSEQVLATRLADAFKTRDVAKHRVESVQQFLEKFDLSAEETELLETYNFADLRSDTSEDHQGWAFLAALERVRQIRQSLQSTFGAAETQEDRSGLGANSALRIMESVSEKQERAYERLYNFLQQQQQQTGDFSSSPFVQQAITALRHVPAFYSHMMELVAGARRAVVTRHFLLALTQGVEGGAPLELKAHDSVTYVGDMLAHVFKAFSVEADLAQSLLHPEEEEGGEEKTESPSAAESDDDDPMFLSAPTVSASSILGIAVSGLCRPLKSRLLQVISNLSSHEGDNDDDDDDDDDDFGDDEGTAARNKLAQLYEICGLLLFYVSTLEKGLHKLDDAEDATTTSTPPNPLIECLQECVKEGASAYEASIRVYAAMLEHTAGGSANGDSQATIVHQLIVQLSKIQSLATMEDERILSIEWATETLVHAAQCTSLDDTVTLSETVTVAQTMGKMNPEVFSKLTQEILSKEQALVDDLVSNELVQVLELCGMAPLMEAFQQWNERGGASLMAQYPGLSPEEVQTAIKEFYESLYSPPLPSLEGVVKDPVVRKRVRMAICGKVCDGYGQLYEAMQGSQGGYSDVRFMGHTPKQVTSLFTV